MMSGTLLDWSVATLYMAVGVVKGQEVLPLDCD